MERLFRKLGDILVKFYLEIVAGVWAVILTMPVDNVLYEYFTGKPSYPNLNHNFWIFFVVYTIFFLLSALLVPLVRKNNMKRTLRKMVRQRKITAIQRNKMVAILKNAIKYKPIWTKDGFCLFLLENFFSIGVMFAYFGIEGLIANFINGETKIVSCIFLGLFLLFMELESLLDEYITKTIRQSNYNNKNKRNKHTAGRTLLMQIIEDIGGGSSSDDFGEMIINETFEDIEEIMSVFGNGNKNQHLLSIENHYNNNLNKALKESLKKENTHKKNQKINKTKHHKHLKQDIEKHKNNNKNILVKPANNNNSNLNIINTTQKQVLLISNDNHNNPANQTNFNNREIHIVKTIDIKEINGNNKHLQNKKDINNKNLVELKPSTQKNT